MALMLTIGISCCFCGLFCCTIFSWIKRHLKCIFEVSFLVWLLAMLNSIQR